MRTGDLGKRGLLDVPKSHSQIIKTLVYFSYCDIFHRMSVLKINEVVYTVYMYQRENVQFVLQFAISEFITYH